MAALVVRAINQEAANAGGAHLGEGDFLLAGSTWAFAHDPADLIDRDAGI
jgi:hypothetical protein